MTFELVADGIRFWCSSPTVTRKLVEKGARFTDGAQAEYLRLMVESGAASEGSAPDSPRSPSTEGSQP
jgi:hypothetical protein